MIWGDGRHDQVAEELLEWWQDLWAEHTGSRVVLLEVPPGWGRSAVLDRFCAAAVDPEGPVGLVARIDGSPLGREVQAFIVQRTLAAAVGEPEVMHALDLDRFPGQVQLAMGVAGLFTSGIGWAASLLSASLAVTAAGNKWDASPAGQQGAVARAGRELARVSAQIPAAVIIDDADTLDLDLALTLVRSLAERPDGQVLLIAATSPGSPLAQSLTRDPGPALVGRVAHAEANPAMAYADRVALARHLLPDLPPAAAERIGRRARTFAEVFTIASTGGRLAELGPGTDAGTVLQVTDTVITAALDRAAPSPEAVALAWAGGALHRTQAQHAREILGGSTHDEDLRVTWTGTLARLAGPADTRTAERVTALTIIQRQQLAAALLGEATRIAADPDAGPVERLVARQAAHHVRGDLTNRTGLPAVQVALIRGLEQLGDPDRAVQVADTALAELPDTGPESPGRHALLTAALRLAHTAPAHRDSPWVEQAVALALAGGAAFRLEARVWAAIDLLNRPGRRQGGLALARALSTDLAISSTPSETVARWRLLLAFHTGYTGGDHALAQQILAPLITRGTTSQQQAAHAVHRAITGPQADTRLQVTFLQAELDHTPAAAEQDLLRLHTALAAAYGSLGEYPSALHHSAHELTLRIQIQGPRHPDTLNTRHDIAYWTAQSGDPAEALRLARELLPDQAALLGPRHPDTLTTRNNIAYWTGRSGDPAEALRLFWELLPDREAVLGPRHPDTLTTRNNIAGWTGQNGNPAEALRLFRELLPDREAVQGPRHPDTLTTRNNIATWTGENGDPAEALRLARELLPDREAVLGPRHPDTLATRNNIAYWTGRSGDPAEAMHLGRELMPDREAVLGPRHPDTLNIRHNIAGWTGQNGDPAEALRLFRELLPDREAVQGPRHPDTLNTRQNIAGWTGRSGDPAEAARLYQILLADQEAALGPRHPATLATRAELAAWTYKSGHLAAALQMYRDLLAELEAILGPRHPDAITVRHRISELDADPSDEASSP